jgi:hypothetical protein
LLSPEHLLEVTATARRRLLAFGVAGLVTTMGAMQACGGATGAVADTPAAEGGAADGDTDGGPTVDAATDGEIITDGGSNIDPDAGDLDGGPDAAPCNTLSNDAPAITSKCLSVVAPLKGGALVAGKYFLVEVNALAAATFCQKSFVATGFKETLQLTVSGTGVGTAETHTSVATSGSRRSTSTLTPLPMNRSPLGATPTCPAAASSPVAYESAIVNGKQELVLRLPYGKAEALYRFERQ